MRSFLAHRAIGWVGMRLRLALLAAATLAAPTLADADDIAGPAIHTALPCYLERQQVRVTGGGFHAADSYSLTLDRTLLGTGLVRAGGTISGRLSSGRVRAGRHHVIHRVVIADGALQAGVDFRTTEFGASFSPATGDPRNLRVRFTVDALGLSVPGGAVVWVHWVDPLGKPRLSAAIGRAGGACGSLRSIRHRLFPLHVYRGDWQLQFDLKSDYSAATRPRIVLRVAVGA